ncbi:MAG: hypothetical protein K8E66_04640 [Phycisphaerales bacterium]|nr:hypothetical protein [Phycisphaerales bacterium]
MKLTITAAALAGLALPAFGGLTVFDLAARYEGYWIDPNFTDGGGDPVGGDIVFETAFDDPTPGDPGDETGYLTVTAGGFPGGNAIPPITVALPINADGLIDVTNIPVPELDPDLLFNTGGDQFPTPTVNATFNAFGELYIEALGFMGFDRIEYYGTALPDHVLFTADVYGLNGFPISLGSTIEAWVVPAPSGWLALLIAGGIVRRRRH